MPSFPAYSSVVAAGSGLIPGTADTSWTAPTNVTSIVTGGAIGTHIYEIVFQGVGTTVAGLVNVFLYDGSTYHLFDSVPVSAVTPSTTAVPYRAARRYSNLFLKNANWILRVTGTVAGNVSLVKVTALGGDFA